MVLFSYSNKIIIETKFVTNIKKHLLATYVCSNFDQWLNSLQGTKKRWVWFLPSDFIIVFNLKHWIHSRTSGPVYTVYQSYNQFNSSESSFEINGLIGSTKLVNGPVLFSIVHVILTNPICLISKTELSTQGFMIKLPEIQYNCPHHDTNKECLQFL